MQLKILLKARKNLPTNSQEAGHSSFLSSVLAELNTLARQVRLTPEFTDHISEVASEGSIYLVHSDYLKIHDSTCSWQQYYPVL